MRVPRNRTNPTRVESCLLPSSHHMETFKQLTRYIKPSRRFSGAPKLNKTLPRSQLMGKTVSN